MGRAIGEAGLMMVYGGGNVGLMGLTADSAIKSGAKVIGIQPAFLNEREPEHPGLTELIKVGDMHTRKRLMAEKSDGFIILPGGFGTLDELAEILTWRQLGLHHKPIVAVDVNGYWSNLKAQIDYMMAEGFIKDQHRGLMRFVPTIADAIPALQDMLATNGHIAAGGPAPAHSEALEPDHLDRT
jgi:uncharacterized protein (TIGR00730 family)